MSRSSPVDAARSFGDLANRPTFDAAIAQLPADAIGVVTADDQHQPYAHVEYASHLLKIDFAESLKPTENRRHGPAPLVDHRASSVWQNPSQVVAEPATGDVRDRVDDAFHLVVRQQTAHGFAIDTRRLEKGMADRLIELGNVIFDR